MPGKTLVEGAVLHGRRALLPGLVCILGGEELLHRRQVLGRLVGLAAVSGQVIRQKDQRENESQFRHDYGLQFSFS